MRIATTLRYLFFVSAVRSLPIHVGVPALLLAPVVANLRTIARGAGIIRRSSLFRFQYNISDPYRTLRSSVTVSKLWDTPVPVPVGRLELPRLPVGLFFSHGHRQLMVSS